MKTGTKVTLIIALILIGIGFILMIIAVMGGANFRDFNHSYNSNNINYDFDENYVTTGMETYNYSSQAVRSLDIDIAAARVTILEGDDFTVKVENTNSGRIYSKLQSDGTLKIDEEIYHRWGSWWPQNFYRPRVFISIPNGSHFESIDIEIAAGIVHGENLNISTNESDFFVEAGSIELSGITSSMTDIDVAAGAIVLSGTFSGETDIDCNAGSIDLHTTGNIDEWSYESETNVGSIHINNNKLSGIGKQSSFTQKRNHFDIECNAGAVRISVN